MPQLIWHKKSTFSQISISQFFPFSGLKKREIEKSCYCSHQSDDFFTTHLLCRCCQQFDIKSLLFLRYEFSNIYQAVHKNWETCMSLSIYSYHLFSTRCNRCCQQFDIKSLLFSQISIQHFLYIVYHAVHKKWEVEEQGRRKQSKFGWAYSMRLKTIIFWYI